MKRIFTFFIVIISLTNCNNATQEKNNANELKTIEQKENAIADAVSVETIQTELGIGIVAINFDENTILHFYTSPNDKEPTRTVEFFNDTTIKGWNIRNLDKQKKWLAPEVLWLDYHYFVFRCLTVEDDWLKVVVNNKTAETLWLKKSDLTTFKNWETYLKEMFGIARLPNEEQKIRRLPTDNSEEIKYQEQECFEVKSMKDDWIEISTAEYCDDNQTKVKSGWIKWRQGNTLLIDYFITS